MLKFFHLFALATLVAMGAAPAAAQTYPARPIKIIVSTSPGGITDILARILGELGISGIKLE
jgi:tripartite-type tricarboxylate transporter receptor subunit TctC